MRVRVLLLLLNCWASSWVMAAGEQLDSDMRMLQQARDLAAMQARMANADAAELDSPEAWVWQSWLALVGAEPDRALALLEQGQAAFPASAALEVQAAQLLTREFDEVGNLAALRLARRVREGFERAIELDPDHVGARVGLIQFYLNAPRIAGGGSTRAEPHLELLKDLAPAVHEDLRIQALAASGDLEQALEALDRALAEQPDPGRYFSRGLILLSQDRHAQARESFALLVAQWPLHGAGWYQLGRTSVLAQDWIEEGQQAFRRFLDLPVWPGDPSHAAAWWRLGQLHALAGETAQARAAFEQSLLLNPDFEEAADSLQQLPALDD